MMHLIFKADTSCCLGLFYVFAHSAAKPQYILHIYNNVIAGGGTVRFYYKTEYPKYF